MEGADRAEGFSTKVMGSFWFGTFFAKTVGNDSLSEKAWARSVLVDAENVRRLGTDGRWQHETPHKQELVILRHVRVEGVLMRQANNAEKSGDWGLFWKHF